MADNQGPTNISLVKLIPEKVIEKVYDDAVSSTAKEVGGLTADLVGTARRILSPIQLLGDPFERFKNWVKVLKRRVPEERQVQAPPEIAGPVIERMKYLESGSPLQELYLNLLARSIDKERQSQAHPGFIRVIEQLSRDEAKIFEAIDALWLPNQLKYTFLRKPRYVGNPPQGEYVDQNFIRWDEVAFRYQFTTYIEHLESLCLIKIVGKHPSFTIEETGFGCDFGMACLPERPTAESARSKSSKQSRRRKTGKKGHSS